MTDNDPNARTDEHGLTYYVRAPERPTEGNLAKHAWDELNRADLFTIEGDFYGGMTGRAVMDLVNVFSAQGHSGISAHVALETFIDLVRLKPLTPLTDNPEEWVFHGEDVAGRTGGLWQSTRQADAFSTDGGSTYYLVDNPEEIFSSEKANSDD